MTRRTLLLLTALVVPVGCRDNDPPSASAPTAVPEPAAESDAPARVHKRAPRAIVPGMRRINIEPRDNAGAADAGDSADAGASADAGPATAPAHVFSFDKDKADEAPAGFDFAASAGKPGKWRVKADPGAPSAPNVLAQLDADKTDARFLTAVSPEPPVRDARVSVRCKPISGKVDQACGVVLRFKDAKSYYVARANALEKNVNLYVVKDGKRTLVGGWNGATFGDAWHELRADAKGDHLEVYWDGTKVYEADDKTFPDAGRVGLWTKADSVTYFDDLSITAL